MLNYHIWRSEIFAMLRQIGDERYKIIEINRYIAETYYAKKNIAITEKIIWLTVLLNKIIMGLCFPNLFKIFVTLNIYNHDLFISGSFFTILSRIPNHINIQHFKNKTIASTISTIIAYCISKPICMCTFRIIYV